MYRIAMLMLVGCANASGATPSLMEDRGQPLQIAAEPEPGCAQPGVQLTVAGDDAVAPARGDRDLATYKFRRDGWRSPTFTVADGPLYVHGVGDFLPFDTGTTRLSLFMIHVDGEDGGYRLARGGRSVMTIEAISDAYSRGTFEADVSRVDDVTREAPFGTPVVRVRGTFCLAVAPRDPSDIGP